MPLVKKEFKYSPPTPVTDLRRQPWTTPHSVSDLLLAPHSAAAAAAAVATNTGYRAANGDRSPTAAPTTYTDQSTLWNMWLQNQSMMHGMANNVSHAALAMHSGQM